MGHGLSTPGARAPTPVAEWRWAAGSLIRSLLVSAALATAYFVLPMTRGGVTAVLVLVAGLALTASLLVWEIRGILRSPHPGIKAVQGLVLVVSVFFVGFATTYFLMGQSNPGTFNQSLSRLDAAYFTVTIFATVGFGDIVAVTEPGRAVTLIQMIADLALIGVVARVVVRAVAVAKGRQEDPE